MKKYLVITIILLAVVLGVNYAKAAYFLSDGLVGHWTMDTRDVYTGTVMDVSGNGNIGNPINIATSTFYKVGKMGQGVNFEVGDQSVQITGQAAGSLDITGNAISISAWVKSPLVAFPTEATTHNTVIYKGGNTTGYRMLLETNGTVLMQVSNGAGNYFSSSSSSKCIANKWCHIVYTYDGATAKLYFNNVQNSTTQSAIGSLVTNATTPLIGASSINYGSSTYHLNGLIDDVRVYNRALSASEVYNLYRYGLSKRNKI